MNYKLLLLVSLFSTPAFPVYAQSQRTSVSTNNGETRIVIENKSEDLELSYKGELTFNESETAVAGIAPGSKLRYRNGDNKLTITADTDGRLTYSCNGGEAAAQLPAPCAGMEREVVALLVRTGVGAKERTARIFARGGASAVLKEVDRLPGDYVRSIYLKALMEQPSLSAADWQLLATRIRSIGSDYEKAGLLRRLLGRSSSAAAVLPAVFDATASVGSDYERAGVLSAVFAQKLDARNYTRATEITATIRSDYEKARVLKAAAAAPGIQFAPLLSAAGSIKSDYEKAGVLKALLGLAGTREEAWTGLFGAAKGIHSDYEKASLLVLAAKKMPRSEKLLAEYRKAAASISSEYELGRVTKAIGTEL
ncbi:hypothetical protein [Flaviaesturariibacter amylovorans]|uniref:HEAT repeat domain-containing protein n=1 Tax=Flaviaesturariibacter amylovorans TaxID=1084520 RepID=A0ABP8GF60_9BACT